MMTWRTFNMCNICIGILFDSSFRHLKTSFYPLSPPDSIGACVGNDRGEGFSCIRSGVFDIPCPFRTRTQREWRHETSKIDRRINPSLFFRMPRKRSERYWKFPQAYYPKIPEGYIGGPGSRGTGRRRVLVLFIRFSVFRSVFREGVRGWAGEGARSGARVDELLRATAGRAEDCRGVSTRSHIYNLKSKIIT